MKDYQYEKYGAEPPLITPEEFQSWILQDDSDVLVLNKPGWVVCHPSKNGPWSSLVGAAREYLQTDKLHLVARLDRETSGLVLLAKHKKAASALQQAFQGRFTLKSYLAILDGELHGRQEVSRAIEDDADSPVHVKQRVSETGGGAKAQSTFIPRAHGGGRTLCEVRPFTGRKHQIRVHAKWLGHPVTGDKLYGPDETLYLDFATEGFSDRLRQQLPLPRQALHCWRLEVDLNGKTKRFEAPLADDMRAFLQHEMQVTALPD